jgi:uncharacterized protein (UPF0332 family)
LNYAEVAIGAARQALAEAESLLKSGFARGAAARAYYAMFYAATALLAKEGKDFIKHRALLAAFGMELVQTGKVPAKYHRMLIDAFELRLDADYDLEAQVDLEHAHQVCEEARDFVAMAGDYLSRPPAG